MKTRYFLLTLVLATALSAITVNSAAQSCTPQGNPAVYGTGNTWIAYLYQGKNFNTYKGYVNEGNSSALFDESFGGAQTHFATNGCSVYTDTFSVRFRLTKTFTAANYTITVGGDDGYRLSLDGGATWVINKWNDQSYGTTAYSIYLSGSYNMVLEFYENFGDNRISFNTTVNCTGNGDPTVYGTSNVWMGYMYQGMAFESYKGYVTKGTSSNANFDDNFGGGSTAVTMSTSNCSIQTQAFSARYRLKKTLAAGNYMITVGGDDGYRLSLDGGATWVINKWGDQSYTTTTYTANLSGTYNMVLEYYQNGGFSRLSFDMNALSLLPVKLQSFSAALNAAGKAQLSFTSSSAIDFKQFTVQRGTDGIHFNNLQTIAAQNSTSSSEETYSYTDQQFAGTMYYRLAMTDINGSVTYSTVLRLSSNVSKSISVYPTLVEGNTLYISSGTAISRATARIYDMTGKQVSEQTLQNVQGRQSLLLNNAVKTGSYVVTVTDNNGQLARQVIIVK
ncbi:MAG TPA: T9SS type A sorting domain-containing protein [Chitinophagaceae bacterium]|nr:T9SS type A sorting domain-containing protein [Chitinophagaceae bacterium]